MSGNTKTGSGRKAARPMGAPGFINPEHVPALAPKWANKVGKTVKKLTIEYTETGVTVLVDGKGDFESQQGVSLAAFAAAIAAANQPSEADKLRSLRNKFELRLNKAFPADGPSSGSEEAIGAWLQTLPFAERRALLMSSKDFEKSYPEGFRA